MFLKKVFLILIILILFFLVAFILPAEKTHEETQSRKAYDLTDVNMLVKADVQTELIEYKGKKAFRLKQEKGERIAYLKDLEFVNGIIELDIAAIPYYTGIVFRVRSPHIYEGIYFRPQNSRHSDPVRRGHTVQYTASPRYTWYYLREKYPEKYEAAVDIPPDEWFHVKVVVSGMEAKVFVNEAKSPCLVVKDLKHGLSKGSVGVWCGNTSSGTFANLTIEPGPPFQFERVEAAEERAISGVSYTVEQKFFLDIFKKRRSVRKFKPTLIPDEHIMKILDAARSAPTSGNQQPWKFLVIQDREKLNKLKAECVSAALERAKKRDPVDPVKLESLRKRYTENLTGYLSAPVFILVLTDKNSRYPSYNKWDGPLAAGYLILAARALGYGTVYTTDSFPADITKKVFAVPDNFEQICCIPVGVPESWPNSPPKKPLQEFVVFEKLIKGVNYDVPIQRTTIELDQKTIGDYVGKFKFEPNITISVTQTDSHLFVQITGQPKVEIFPEAKDKFFLKVVDAQITFVRDTEGRISKLLLHQGGRTIPAEKIQN